MGEVIDTPPFPPAGPKEGHQARQRTPGEEALARQERRQNVSEALLRYRSTEEPAVQEGAAKVKRLLEEFSESPKYTCVSCRKTLYHGQGRVRYPNRPDMS